MEITLWQYLNMYDKKIKNKIDLGKSLIDFIAQDAVNKLAVENLTITTGSEDTDSSIANTLALSRFPIIRREVEYNLAKGVDCALIGLLRNDNSVYIANGEILSYKEVANELQEITVLVGDIVIRNKDKIKKLVKFELDNGVVKKWIGYFNIESRKIVLTDDKPVIYDTDIIPAQRINNNAKIKGDICELAKTINELNSYSNSFMSEWKKSSLQFGINKNFDQTKTAIEWQKMLESDKDVHMFNSPDSTLQVPLTQLTGSIATIQQLLLQYNYLEDKILKYSFTMRETSNTGTNKHNLEVAAHNQAAFEYIINKKRLRELDLQWFLWKILHLLNKNIKLSDISVENPISRLESIKLEMNEAQVALMQAQASAAQAQALQALQSEEPEETPEEE